MRIACHVFSPFGTGHLRRAGAIAGALAGHDWVWLGQMPEGAPGRRVDTPLVIDAPTPMDLPARERLQAHGAAVVADWRHEPPDLLITEHYPFGHRNLDAVLIPLLKAARHAGVPVVASVRDILAKERPPVAWQQTALLLDHCYEGVLWHGDPGFLPFDFPLAQAPPLTATGYVQVAEAVPPSPEERHCVATCSNGLGDGASFIQAVLAAGGTLALQGWRLTLITGPPLFGKVRARVAPCPPWLTLLSWTPDLPALLATASVVVSQCGYNTFVETVASRRPTVYLPFALPGNHEQLVRARALCRFTGYRVLPADTMDLPARLAATVAALAHEPAEPPALKRDGVLHSVHRLGRWLSPSRPRS